VLLAAIVVTGCSLEARKARYLKHGEEYFKAGQYENAKIEYMKLLLADPTNPLPFERVGFIWLEEGAPLRAIGFLFKAKELAPTNLENRLSLARALVSLARVAEARKEVQAVLDQSPANDDAIILLADTNQTKEDLDYSGQYLQNLSPNDGLSFQLASANLAVQRGDFASAEKLLDRCLALDPKSSRAHLAMASLDVYRKKLDEAEQEFKAAAELSPIRSSTRLRYAEFELQNRPSDELEAFLRNITHQAPDCFPAWCFLAEIALTKQRYDESLKLLENVLSRDPENVEARILEAETWRAKGDSKKAVERFEDLEKKYTDVPVINYRLAQAYIQNNNPSQAMIALGHAIAAKPDYLDAILLRAELDLQAGNAGLVIPGMTTILRQRPHWRPAELLLTEAYLSLGRFEEAAAVIRDEISTSPDDADSYYQLGLVLREQNKLDEATAAFEKVAQLTPANLKAINQLVDLDIAKKNYDSAMLRIRQELNKQPGSGIVRFMEGKTYAAEGKLDQAESTLLKALELDPNSLGIYQLLISTYLSDNKPAKAVAQLEALLSKDQKQTWALATLASTYMKIGDFSKSRDTYEKILSFNPDSADALNNLASLYLEKFNNPTKAYDLATKAKTLAPVDPLIADTLGWICYKQGNYQEALNLSREAAGKRPDDPRIQFHFGMANYMMDRPEAAEAAFNKALAAERDFSQKDEAAGWLAFLKGDASAQKQVSTNELEALIELRPKDVVARSRLAALYEKQGADAKAAAQYEAALNINPNLPNAALKLAQLYSGPLRNPARALEIAKTARELDKSDPQTAHILGKIAYQTGNFAWAYDLLEQSIRSRSGDPVIAYDLAWAAYSLGKVVESQQRMRQALALELDPQLRTEGRRFLDLVALDRDGKNLTRYEAEITKQLREDAGYVPALMLQAAIQSERSDSKTAADTYNEILQRFPDFAPAQKKLAYLYAQDSSTVDRAYELALKARNGLPEDPEVARTLGELCYQRKDYAYSLQLLQDSAKRMPLDAKGLYCLGMSYLAAQDETQSYDALTRSLTAGLAEPLASEAKRVLADLERKRHKDS
jgi:tetratricopeptide (TPR) repeat protein